MADQSGVRDVIQAIHNEDYDLIRNLLSEPTIVAGLKRQVLSNDLTALSIACAQGFPVCVEILLRHGLNPNMANLSGQRPIMAASTVDCMVQLVKYGADINAMNKNGRTALMQQCIVGNIPCLEYLLGQGAELDMVDKDGQTALMWAVRGRHEYVMDTINLLLRYGADPGILDKRGSSALALTRSDEVRQLLSADKLRREAGDDSKNSGSNESRAGGAGISSSTNIISSLANATDNNLLSTTSTSIRNPRTYSNQYY